MPRGTSIAAALVFLVVVSGVIGVAAAASAGTASPSTSNSSGNWTLEELEQGGTQIESADPSRRGLGSGGSVYVSYKETNFIKELGQKDPEWAVDHVVAPGKTVDTDTVTMHFSRAQDADSETVKVHVVQFEKKSRQVQEGNTTQTEWYAANVTEKVHEVKLSGSFDTAEISLPSADSEKQVLLYVDGYPSARWTFPHHSIATSATLPFGATWSSFLPWFATRFFLLTAIGVPLAIGGAIKTLDFVGAPPGKGAIWWVIMGGLAAYFALYFSYGSIVDVLVTAPYVMGGSIVALSYVATLEYADPTKKALIERLTTKKVKNPIGETVPDIMFEEGQEVHVVDRDDEVALAKKGSIRQFLLVLAGAKLPTIPVSDLRSQIAYEGPYDAKFYAAESEDEDAKVIDVEWPSLEIGAALKQPVDPLAEDLEEKWDRDTISKAFLFFAGTATLANPFVGVTLALALAVVPVTVVVSELRDGEVTFMPAPAHSNPAKAARITERTEYALGETFEKLVEDQADNEVELISRFLTLAEAKGTAMNKGVAELFGLEDPPDVDIGTDGAQEVSADD